MTEIVAGQTAGAPQPALRTKLGRFVPLLLVAGAGWTVANSAAGTLLQAASHQFVPGDPVGFYSVLSTAGAVFACLATVFAGALSDRTRSRFGRRVPWIVLGGLAATLALGATGLTGNVVVVIAAYAIYQVGLTSMNAAASALVPDHLDQSVLGKASALLGVGVLLGSMVGGFVAAGFVTVPRTGLTVVPWTILAGAVVLAVFLPRRSSRGLGRAGGSPRDLLRFPRQARFWWVFAGRFLFVLGLNLTIQFPYFVATGYLGLDSQAAGNLLALCALVLAVCSGVAIVVSGPLSDRVGRKPFVVGAPLLTCVGVVPLLLAAQPWALVTLFVLGGVATGAYLSVDAALMVDVLPDRDRAARDLAVLNAANTLPLVFSPAAAGTLVAIGGFPSAYVATIVCSVAGAACVFFVKGVR